MRDTLALTVIWILVFLSPASAKEIQPGPGIPPEQVVVIQLTALQRNNQPEPNYGINRTWQFAHPFNKQATGPLERFTQMILSPAYQVLINHRSHQVEPLFADQDQAVFGVLIETDRGQMMAFQWVVARVTTGPQKGAWMTIRVSPPIDVEENT